MTVIREIILLLVILSSASVFATPGYLTFQAKILLPQGGPLAAPSVDFRMTTLDPSGTCVLYVETFGAVPMTSAAGMVTLKLGSGAAVYSSVGSSFTKVFDNNTASYSCQAGGTYTPTSSDNRKVVMQFYDGPTSGWQTVPPIEINSTPFASYAGDSDKLSGHTGSEYPLLSNFPNCNALGKVLTFTGTSFTCISPSAGSGTVTSVTSANSYLSVATTTTTPVLTANVGTAANTLAAGNDSRITGALQKANNLSDLNSATTARTNLGLGTAAVVDTGTGSGNVPVLDGSGKIPSALLPSSALTSSTSFVGDVTGTSGATVVSSVGTKTSAQVAQSVSDTVAATNLNTASTLVKRDASGNVAVGILSAASITSQNATFNGASTNYSFFNIFNTANTIGQRGYRWSFDNDRLTFQSTDDSGTFQANHLGIYQSSGNVTIGKDGSGAVTSFARLGVKGSTSDATATALEVRNQADTPLVSVRNDGNVGIGTSSPTSTLHVKGTIVSESANTTNAYINFGLGNVQMSSTSATTINLCGLKDGGSYTLVLTGITAGSTVTIKAYPTYVNSSSCSGTAMQVDLSNGDTQFTTSGSTSILSFIYFSSRGANGTVYGVPATNYVY